MIKYVNECVGCPKEMGCLGDSCPNRHVPYIYCDICHKEIDYDSKAWDTNSEYHVCEECDQEEE